MADKYPALSTQGKGGDREKRALEFVVVYGYEEIDDPLKFPEGLQGRTGS